VLNSLHRLADILAEQSKSEEFDLPSAAFRPLSRIPTLSESDHYVLDAD
jgi:hypothetical protein